eukprot:gene18893-25451_t
MVNFIHEADQETSLNSERIIQLMAEGKEKDEKIRKLDLEISLKSESIIKLKAANSGSESRFQKRSQSHYGSRSQETEGQDVCSIELRKENLKKDKKIAELEVQLMLKECDFVMKGQKKGRMQARLGTKEGASRCKGQAGPLAGCRQGLGTKADTKDGAKVKQAPLQDWQQGLGDQEDKAGARVKQATNPNRSAGGRPNS